MRRPATARRLAFKSARHCPRCQGEFCYLVRALDIDRDIQFQPASSGSSLNAAAQHQGVCTSRAFEKGNERDRAYRIIRWVLTDEEEAKLDESGKLIRLRVTGKVDPFAYKAVPTRYIEAARSEHRSGLAKLELAEESTLIPEDEWAALVKTQAELATQGRNERAIGPTPKADEALVCVVCHHVYNLLERAHQILGSGKSAKEEQATKGVISDTQNSEGQDELGSLVEDDTGSRVDATTKTPLSSPPPARTISKGKKARSKEKESSPENSKPDVTRTSTGDTGSSSRKHTVSSKQRQPLHQMDSRNRRPRILVADHDADAMRIIKANLRSSDYDVRTASDGRICLDILETSGAPFDVLLLAKNLVSKDAVEITKWLRCRHQQENKPLHGYQRPLPQIIIMTSEVTPLDLRSYVHAGIDGCLRTPIETKQLLTTVKDSVNFLARKIEAAKKKAAAMMAAAEDGKKEAKANAKTKAEDKATKTQKKESVEARRLTPARKEKDRDATKAKVNQMPTKPVVKAPLSASTSTSIPSSLKAPISPAKLSVPSKIAENLDPNAFSGTFQLDESTLIPYTVLDSGFGQQMTGASAPSDSSPVFNLVVCHDIFDTQERMSILLSALVAKHPGIQILLWNYPGQALTSFADGTVLNNEFHASCLDKLMHHVSFDGNKRFGSNRPFFLLGHGHGGSIASSYASNYHPASLRGLLLINSLSFVDPHYASVFHDCSNVFKCTPETRPDLPIYFYTRFIFSPSYLVKTSASLALNLYTAVHNPITLHGRTQLCLGALSNVDTRPFLKDIAAPIISIHSEQSSLVRPLHAKSYVDGRTVTKSIHGALKGADRRTCITIVKGGHELFQEKKKQMVLLIEQLLTGQFESNDVANPLITTPVVAEGGVVAKSEESRVAMTTQQPPPARFEDNFIDSILESTKRTTDPSSNGKNDKRSAKGRPKSKTKSADIKMKERIANLLLDPTNPSFERQNNTIYKAGGNSSIYPDPKEYPEVSEYMAWRLKRNRKQMLKRDRSARILQGTFRVFMARTILDRLKRQQSALTIQRCCRGWRGRIYFKQCQKDLWAARFVQRALRGHRGRCRSYHRRLQLESQTRLAKRWRGAKARRVVLALIARRNLAATYVQCLWRRFMAKDLATYHRVRRDASTVIQRLYRGHRGRRRATREREKYLFSRSQSSGIELGRQLLAEHKLHATRLQSEISLLDQDKRAAEERADVLLKEIRQFEDDVTTLEKEMHTLTKAERENAAVLKGKLKHELRDQKIRLDKQFGVMLAKIADRKQELKGVEKKLLDLGVDRQKKNEEMKSLERKLVVLLEAQEAQIEALRRMKEERHEAATGAVTTTSAEAITSTGPQAQVVQYQGPSLQEKQEAAELMTSTEQMMKFGFMSMSMTYFSSLNMVRAMKKVGAQDTVMAAVAAGADNDGAVAVVPSSTENGTNATPYDPNSSSDSIQVRSWSVDDVLKWLSALRLDLYVDSFREGAVDGNFLCQLNDEDLRSTLGVEHKLHRKKILCSIDELLNRRLVPQGSSIASNQQNYPVYPVPSSPSLHSTPLHMKEMSASDSPATREEMSIAPTGLHEYFHESIASPTAPMRPVMLRTQSMLPPALSSLAGAAGVHADPRRQTAPVAVDPRSVPLHEMEPGQSRSNINRFQRSSPVTSTSNTPTIGADFVPPTFDEMATWVRNKKVDSIREALDVLPTKPYNESNTRVQFVDDIGTAYVESYDGRIFHLNKVDEHSNTLLHVAAQNGNVRIAKLLISKGANPNHQNKEGQTPGHFALAYQFYDFASWLFDVDGGKANDTLTNIHGLGPYDGLGRDATGPGCY